jgi:hypothetical protein
VQLTRAPVDSLVKAGALDEASTDKYEVGSWQYRNV